jgi:hypothetical protein
MRPLLRNVLAFVAGVVVGGLVNSALVALSPSVIATPPGVDVNDAASLSASMHLFEPRHFLMPFLAHAAGTFAGALVACLVAATHRAQLACAVGVVFLCGGLAASVMIPAPKWFIALDLLLAYLPMAWIAVRVATRWRPVPNHTVPEGSP